MKKRLFSLVLALILCAGLQLPAFAAQSPSVIWFDPELTPHSLLAFSEGLLSVSKGDSYGNCGFIDKTGQVVIPLEYYDVSRFSDGLAAVGKERADTHDVVYGYIDKTGQVVIPLEYEQVGDFSEGLAPVCRDYKWGYIDKTGKTVIPFEYDFAYSFQNGIAHVEKGGRRGVIDKNGQVIIPFEYIALYGFSDGIAPAMLSEMKWNYINMENECVIPFDLRYSDVWSFSDEGVAVVRVGSWYTFKCGLIDRNGKEVVPLIYDELYGFSEGVSAAQKGNAWGYIDKNGSTVLPFQYQSASNFSEGLAAVKIGEKWGYIDKSGEIMIPAEYDDAYNFHDGAAIVKKDGRLGLLTLSAAPAPLPTVGGFTDVKSTDYFADAVLWAVEKNITSGVSKTTFSPNATCSKAQILTFLWRANGSPEPTISNPFADIKPADYYYKAALWAAEKGLVSGSTFGADVDCTRAMTVEYLWKAAGSPAPSGKAGFTDVPASADYAQAVLWAVEKEITSGVSKTTFSPDATCTRGQIVTFLYRAMQ